MHDRTINVRNTLDFPSLNGQHTTVLPCARTRKQNQSVNTRDLNSFPALGQEPPPPPKPSKPTNNIRMAAMLKKPVESPKLDKNKEGPSISRLPNQAKDFPSLDGNLHQTKVKEVAVAASSSANSGSSWVSKAKTANENCQDSKKKAKKEPAAIKKKIAEAPKVPGPSDFPNLNKKLEPSKSNLAKLGNKKKTDIAKKNTISVENHNNNSNNQNGKKNGVLIVAENNSKKPTESNKSTDNNKENNKPKLKPTEVQCNGTNELSKTTKTAAANTINIKVSVEPKKELLKKKETVSAVLEKSEETIADVNNLKDKKKRKKNENKELFQQVVMTATSGKQTDLEQLESNHSKSNVPKVPPGFENRFHHSTTIRAPPGLVTTVSGNSNQRPQTQTTIKAPPGLSLNNNINTNSKQFEYLHPVRSAERNKVLITNLMVALIPARDERFDTFEKFKEMSTLFRKHIITAYDFYSYCVEALCPNSFESVFQELVLLLPDIQKQQVCIYYCNM